MRYDWPRRARTSSPSTFAAGWSVSYPMTTPADLEQTVKQVEALDLCVPRISSAAVTSRVALLAVRP